MEYTPACEVVAVFAVLVSRLVKVTVAPGITPPCASVTVPCKLARYWAKQKVAKSRNRQTTGVSRFALNVTSADNHVVRRDMPCRRQYTEYVTRDVG